MKTFNLLFILFIFIQKFQTTKTKDNGKDFKLTEEQKKEFLNNASFLEYNLSQLVPEYTLIPGNYDKLNSDFEVLKQLRWKFMFENKQRGEHMISVWLTEDLNDFSYELSFTQIKTNFIKKKLINFDQTELLYQANAIQHLMNLVVTYQDFWDGNQLNFNMISDIKQIITKKSENIGNIKFEDHTKPDLESGKGSFVFYLKSNESYIGKFEIFISYTEEEKFTKPMPISSNYIINIGLTISQENELNSGWLQIPMISYKQESLQDPLNQIMSVLTLNNYFNNTDELGKEIIQFLKKNIQKISIDNIDNDNVNPDNKVVTIKLSFQYQSLILKINHFFKDDLSGYLINVYYPEAQEPHYSLEFGRMSKTKLDIFLTENKFHQIFRSAFDDISEMFLTNFETNKANLSDLTTPIKYSSYNLFSSATIGYKNNDIILSYDQEEKNQQKCTLRLISNSKKIKYKHDFFLKKYNHSAIKEMIEAFFRLIAITK